MEWWNSFSKGSAPTPDDLIGKVRLTLPGWSELPREKSCRTWRNEYGDVIIFNLGDQAVPNAKTIDENKVRNQCRRIAEHGGAGLIEAIALSDGGLRYITKRLRMPAYVYTGMLITYVGGVETIWTTLAGEIGSTGVREAVVTATLMSEGKLLPEEYATKWGQDPYDPAYRGVDRSVLRFMSDDERYDQQFPEHPLSRVRRVLAAIPKHTEYDS